MLEKIDRYILKKRIGVGGQATVYLGEDSLLGRPVAVKVMNQMASQQKEYVESLKAEAKLTAGLSHQYIATVYDFKVEDDVACIIMEYVPDSLDREIQANGPMSPSRAVQLAIQISDALTYAHSQGFVHRDIKPHNILLTEDGMPKITDFGIARATDLSYASVLGTPVYMSPEQCRGEEAPDIRSDIYSLGITLYEMLSGQVPFQGNTPQLFKKHTEEPMPKFPSNLKVAPNLAAIVSKCMEKNPDERYQSGLEVANALRVIAGKPLVTEAVIGNTTVRLGSITKTLKINPVFTKKLLTKKDIPWTKIMTWGIGVVSLVALFTLSIPTVLDLIGGSSNLPGTTGEESNSSMEISVSGIKSGPGVEATLPSEFREDQTYLSKVRIHSQSLEEDAPVNLVFRRIQKEDEPEAVKSITALRTYEITLDGIEDSSQASATISFSVNKNWLLENNIDNNEISLYKLIDELVKLPTTFVDESYEDEDNTYLNYEAVTPGFSIFVIGTETVAPQIVETSPGVESTTSTELASSVAPSAPPPSATATPPTATVSSSDATTVKFPDQALESAVRQALGKGPNDPLTKNDLLGITTFTAEIASITDIGGIENLTNLTYLALNINQITDISPLSSLTNLRSLNLAANQITDVSHLESLTNLEILILQNNQITDVSPLSSLLNLMLLSLWDNQIIDVSPLSSLNNLETLSIGDNLITDVSPVESLPKLTLLLIDGNPIDYFPDQALESAVRQALGKGPNDPLTKNDLATLTVLKPENLGISDFSGIENAVNLTTLYLDENRITDLSPLADLTNLTEIGFSSNQITDLSPIASLTNLTVLSIDKNQISDITPLASLTNLKSLHLHDNWITDISPLSSLTNLESLNLGENQITDISPLSSLTNLKVLNLEDNQITDISPVESLNLDTLILFGNPIDD